MAFQDWRDAAVSLDAMTASASEQQRALGTRIGIDIPEGIPEIVAAARLQTAVAAELQLPISIAPTDRQLQLIADLARSRAGLTAPRDQREADGWITYLRLRTRRDALAELQLCIGDIVAFAGYDDEVLAEVSSIGTFGRVNFKGGMGRGAWPDLLELRCRAADSTPQAQQLREKAANQKAARARADSWSLVKHAELRPYEVKGPLTSADVELLQDTIDHAADEKPIQRLLAERPQLLTSLLGGWLQFCLPQVRFGAQYVADFLIATVDSLGVRWILVELETPRTSVTLRGTGELDRHGREGVRQVQSWREWLKNNLPYARSSRRDNGLGLPDIRDSTDGLVLVGRRDLLYENSAPARHILHEQSRIDVHTYDWLLEQLHGTLRYSGPWATNPHLLHRADDDLETGW
jgi:hypothetical protein